MSLDWRLIFQKYVCVVGDAEGVDFLEHRDDRLTDEEWTAIEEALAEDWAGKE